MIIVTINVNQLFNRFSSVRYRPGILFSSGSGLQRALLPLGCALFLHSADLRPGMASRPKIKRVHYREDRIEVGDLQDDRKVHRSDLSTTLYT